MHYDPPLVYLKLDRDGGSEIDPFRKQENVTVLQYNHGPLLLLPLSSGSLDGATILDIGDRVCRTIDTVTHWQR